MKYPARRASVVLAFVLTFLGVALASTHARATPNFPPAIREDLGLGYEPSCSICHAGGVTERGTVTTPFGRALRERGLVADDTDSLKGALAALEKDGIDSDGDGVPDVEQLREGRDPNGTGERPTYGCSSTKSDASTGGSLGVVLVAMLLVSRRRR